MVFIGGCLVCATHHMISVQGMDGLRVVWGVEHCGKRACCAHCENVVGVCESK